MSLTKVVALAVAATALVAAGCGGSSKTESTGTSTSAPLSTPVTTTATTKAAAGRRITRAESILIARADAICKRVRVRHRLEKLGTKQDDAREIPLFAAYQQAAFAELGKLAPPASTAHQWKLFAAAVHALASDTTRLGEYVKAYRFATAEPVMTSIDKDEIKMKMLATRDAVTGCEQIY